MARGISRAWARQPSWKARMSVSGFMSALERDPAALIPPPSESDGASGNDGAPCTGDPSAHSHAMSWWKGISWSYWRRAAWLRARKGPNALGSREAQSRALGPRVSYFRVPSSSRQRRPSKQQAPAVPFKAYGVLLGVRPLA